MKEGSNLIRESCCRQVQGFFSVCFYLPIASFSLVHCSLSLQSSVKRGKIHLLFWVFVMKLEVAVFVLSLNLYRSLEAWEVLQKCPQVPRIPQEAGAGSLGKKENIIVPGSSITLGIASLPSSLPHSLNRKSNLFHTDSIHCAC